MHEAVQPPGPSEISMGLLSTLGHARVPLITPARALHRNTLLAAFLGEEEEEEEQTEGVELNEPIDLNDVWIVIVSKEKLSHQVDQGLLYVCSLDRAQPVTFTVETCTTDPDNPDVVTLNITRLHVMFEDPETAEPMLFIR